MLNHLHHVHYYQLHFETNTVDRPLYGIYTSFFPAYERAGQCYFFPKQVPKFGNRYCSMMMLIKPSILAKSRKQAKSINPINTRKPGRHHVSEVDASRKIAWVRIGGTFDKMVERVLTSGPRNWPQFFQIYFALQAFLSNFQFFCQKVFKGSPLMILEL